MAGSKRRNRGGKPPGELGARSLAENRQRERESVGPVLALLRHFVQGAWRGSISRQPRHPELARFAGSNSGPHRGAVKSSTLQAAGHEIWRSRLSTQNRPGLGLSPRGYGAEQTGPRFVPRGFWGRTDRASVCPPGVLGQNRPGPGLSPGGMGTEQTGPRFVPRGFGGRTDRASVCPPGVWGQSRWVSLFGAAKEIVRPNGEPPSQTKNSRSALVSARSEGPNPDVASV